MLSDRAKDLRPAFQAALNMGGLHAICDLTAKLESRVDEPEKRLSMNSSNSSKPPSGDGLNHKTKSLRCKNTGRKPGDQPGSIGQTLSKVPSSTSLIRLLWTAAQTARLTCRQDGR